MFFFEATIVLYQSCTILKGPDLATKDIIMSSEWRHVHSFAFRVSRTPQRKCNYFGLALKDYTQHPTFRFFVFVVLCGKVDNSRFDSKKSIVPRLLTRGHWGRNVFRCVVNATRELPFDHSLLQLFYLPRIEWSLF